MLEQLQSDLSALEQIPEFPIDEFLRLGSGVASEVSEGLGASALVASDNRLVVRLGGNLELFAAAVAALKRYVGHTNSSVDGRVALPS